MWHVHVLTSFVWLHVPIGQVRSIAPDPTGQWLASGGDDGTLKVWEIRSGRLLASHALGGGAAVLRVAWCPDPALRLLSAAVGNSICLLPSGNFSREACLLPAALARADVCVYVMCSNRSL